MPSTLCVWRWAASSGGGRGPNPHNQKVLPPGPWCPRPAVAGRSPVAQCGRAEESPRQLGGGVTEPQPAAPSSKAARREAGRLHCGAGPRPSWRRAGPCRRCDLSPRAGCSLGDTGGAPLPATLTRVWRQEPSRRFSELQRAVPRSGCEGPRPVWSERAAEWASLSWPRGVGAALSRDLSG